MSETTPEPTTASAVGPTVADAAPGPIIEWSRYDTFVVILVALATIVVHPVHFMLRHPFWLDEAWVAVLTRAPLRELPHLGASAPFGFIALLKLVPGSGSQRGRLLVLGFSVLTVVASYVLTRTLAWNSRSVARFAATVTAFVVMLAPLSLVRNDLKQYTCDAFCAVAVLALGGWAERTYTRWWLLWLSIGALAAVPFSSTALFVAVAVFAGLLASAAMDRDRRRVTEVLVSGGVTGGLLVVYFVAMVAPDLNPKLKAYWETFYLRGSPFHIVASVWSRLSLLNPYLAMPAAVFIVLFVIGEVVLVRLGSRAIAIAMPLLWLEMVAMGRLQRYPFLDLRTSNFLLVSSLVVVGLGAVGVVGAVHRLPIVTGTAASVVVAVMLAVLFTVGFADYLDDLHLPAEDVRSQTHAVAAQERAGDVVLVDESANFGFSYYWPHGHVLFHRDSSGQGFGAQVEGLDAVYIPTRAFVDVLAGLREADDRWRAAGPKSRLFIVRTHVSTDDVAIWHRAFETLGLEPQVETVGSEPLLVLGPIGSGHS